MKKPLPESLDDWMPFDSNEFFGTGGDDTVDGGYPLGVNYRRRDRNRGRRKNDDSDVIKMVMEFLSNQA